MKTTSQNHSRQAPHRFYYWLPRGRRRQLPPNLPFRDSGPLDRGLDEACWVVAAGGAAIGIRSIADHREADQ
jgi:hypothetical protein